MHARDVGRYDAEFATDVGRSIGFWVKGIDVGRATLHPHEDNTEVIDGFFFLGRSSVCLKKVGKSKASEAEASNANKFSSVGTFAIMGGAESYFKHGSPIELRLYTRQV